MKRFPFIAVMACLVLFLTACDSDSSSDDAVSVEDFNGSWQATSHVFRNNANTAQSFDIIAVGGETRITVLTGGRMRAWITLGDFSDEWDSQITVSGNTLTMDPVEAGRPTEQFTFSMNGSVLSMTNVNAEFDFTLQGGPEVPATQSLTFVKQ